MSHTPPIREANASPFPAHPAPQPEVAGVTIAAPGKLAAEEASSVDDQESGPSLTLIGSAVAGVGAVVAAAAWFFARRGPAPKRRSHARKAPAKRTTTRTKAKKAA